MVQITRVEKGTDWFQFSTRCGSDTVVDYKAGCLSGWLVLKPERAAKVLFRLTTKMGYGQAR